MVKKQKVRFHRGDKRPNNEQPDLSYTKKMIKRGKDIMCDIINFAKKKGCRKVKLSALFHVVGYYYKVLGFRFSKKNNRWFFIYKSEQ